MLIPVVCFFFFFFFVCEQFDEDELERIKNSVDYSPIFNIVVSDSSEYDNFLETSQIFGNSGISRVHVYFIGVLDQRNLIRAYMIVFTGKTSNEGVIELQTKLSDYIDQLNKITEEKVRAFAEEQQIQLKKHIKRATDDFQILQT